jgi:sulfur-carrier protein
VSEREDAPVIEVRVVLPVHLRNLAKVGSEVRVKVLGAELTQRRLLDAVEAEFPVLLGTMRDRNTGKRRALVRFYACEEDLSNEAPDAPLPAVVADAIASGREPFLVVGSMAGG